MRRFSGVASDMALAGVAHEGDVAVTLAGTAITAHVVIQHTYAASIDFVVFGKPYGFVIKKWSSRGMANFIRLFHSVPRDPAVFGEANYDADGNLEAPGPTMPQKIASILQACRDVMSCVDRVLTTHGRGVLDYAVWYRETHTGEETYPKYITKLAAHSIVHANFLAPAVVWDLVMFVA
jgi:hypothetical protein